MTTKQKLPVDDFYSQFHGVQHHNDPGGYVKPKHHLKNPGLAAAHKGLDLKALRNRKRKVPVLLQKSGDAMRLELTRKGK